MEALEREEERTMEALEREEELTDFVSTAKGVLQALVEKHFPAPDRDRIHRLLGIGKPKSLLDELGIGRKEAEELNGAGTSDGKRRRRQAAQKKKTKYADGGDDSEDSDFEERGGDGRQRRKRKRNMLTAVTIAKIP